MGFCAFEISTIFHKGLFTLDTSPDFLLIFDAILFIVLAGRVIGKRPPVSEALAWILLMLIVPIIGGIIFIIFTETPLGRKRANRATALRKELNKWHKYIKEVPEGDLAFLGPEAPGIAKLISHRGDFPVLNAENLDLFSNEAEILERIISDIESSQECVHLCSYIWKSSGKIKRLEESLKNAALRGIKCRILLDDIGSSSFLGSGNCHSLEMAGVEVVSALKSGLFRSFFRRIDLRNHRKIFTIDRKISYTGSMNLVDSSSYGPWLKLGGWVDACIRLEGDAARILDFVFCWDWYLETEDKIGEQQNLALNPSESNSLPHKSQSETTTKRPDPPATTRTNNIEGQVHSSNDVKRKTAIQIVPTGRNLSRNHIHDIFLNFIFKANHKITITTPYLVPTDGLLSALCSAGKRGVEVNIIVPAKSDDKIVQLASEASYNTLVRAGVNLYQYQGGLLHAKTLTFDNKISMVGSLNMDTRSFYINFEICPFIYDEKFTLKLTALQNTYIEASDKISDNTLKESILKRSLQSFARLLSPIL